MQRPFDELVEQTSVHRGEKMTLDDEDGGQADGHALIRVQNTFAFVMGCENSVHVSRRDPGHVHVMLMLDEAQSSQGITDKLVSMT
jgi:hypothetical protein